MVHEKTSCCVGACLQVPATGATAAADPGLQQQQADLAAKQQQLAAQHQALAAQLSDLAAAAAGQAAGLDQLRAAVGGKADAAALEGLAASVAGAAPAAELAGVWEGLREGLKGKADKGEVDALLGLLQVRKGRVVGSQERRGECWVCELCLVGHSVCSGSSMPGQLVGGVAWQQQPLCTQQLSTASADSVATQVLLYSKLAWQPLHPKGYLG